MPFLDRFWWMRGLLGALGVFTVLVMALAFLLLQPSGTLSLPWDLVETLTLSTIGGAPRTYTVTGEMGKITIGWDANAPRVDSHDSANPLSPAELATLIERHSGVVLVRESVIGGKIPPQE